VHTLKQFISRFRDSLLLALYLFLSASMMLSSDSAIVEGLRSTTLFSVGFIQNQLTGVQSYFSLRQTNRSLRLENTRLAYENYQLQDALLENIRLHELLNFSNQSDYKFTTAKIIGTSPLNFVTGYLLSLDDQQVIQTNSAVMTTEGLVGKIINVQNKYAICQNLLDGNSKISVRIQRNRELGIAAWDGVNSLVLQNISNTIEVLPGDVIYTSGMSRIYPEHIKVGVVINAQKNEEALFQSIRVKAAVNFSNLEEVVIVHKENDEF